MGFVGRRLVPALRGAGHEVADEPLDVTDGDAVRARVAHVRPDAAVHLAALSFVPDSFRAPEAVFRVNFLGTRHLLAAARAAAPRARLLVVGTGHVYGTSPADAAPFDESAPLRPESPYARAKAAADLLAARYAAAGLDVVRLRPFNHTGRGRPEHFVESSLARQVAELAAGLRAPRLVVGNLDAVRDFLDVRDVVAAYLRLLDPGVPTGLYNVASGSGRTIRELLQALLRLAGLPAAAPEIVVEPARWRPTDRAVGDATRLRAATGWEPRVPFEDTLRELLDGWRGELSAA